MLVGSHGGRVGDDVDDAGDGAVLAGGGDEILRDEAHCDVHFEGDGVEDRGLRKGRSAHARGKQRGGTYLGDRFARECRWRMQ